MSDNLKTTEAFMEQQPDGSITNVDPSDMGNSSIKAASLDNLKTWPKSIYLRSGIDLITSYKGEEVEDPSWWETSENIADIEYIRKDIHDERIKELEDKLSSNIRRTPKRGDVFTMRQYGMVRFESFGTHSDDCEIVLMDKDFKGQSRYPKASKVMDEFNANPYTEKIKELEAKVAQLVSVNVDYVHVIKEHQERIKKQEESIHWLKAEKELQLRKVARLQENFDKLESEKIAKQWYPLQGEGNPDFDSRMKIAIDALTKLSRLGNGDLQGNSDGNRIAQEALLALLPTGSKG